MPWSPLAVWLTAMSREASRHDWADNWGGMSKLSCWWGFFHIKETQLEMVWPKCGPMCVVRSGDGPRTSGPKQSSRCCLCFCVWYFVLLSASLRQLPCFSPVAKIEWGVQKNKDVLLSGEYSHREVWNYFSSTWWIEIKMFSVLSMH